MKLAAQRSGIADEALASRLNVSLSSLRHYYSGLRNPRAETILEFSKITDCSLDWLFGKNEQILDAHLPKNQPDEDLSYIDVIDVNLLADGSVLNLGEAAEAVTGQIGFSTKMLDREGINPNQAKIVQVVGGSMEPTLTDGSLVMIDLRDKQPTNKGLVFAIRIGEQAMIKRIELLPDFSVLVQSDNPIIPSYTIDKSSDGFEAIGRVVWSARTWPENKLM